MPTKAETAYPRLKNYVTARELIEIYTPTQKELALANQYTKKGATKIGFLVLLKTFQRLGYFVDPDIVPTKHINRFGSYSLDLNRKPPTLDFGFSLIPSS